MPLIYNKPSFSNEVTFEISNLECVRGYTQLFTALNFKMESASALQLMGANGSGKTSLLRILAGLSQPERGTISWNGNNITDNPFEYFASVNYLGHKIALKDNLSPGENLSFLGSLDHYKPTISVAQSLQIMAVMALADSPCFQLSAGQRQRIALARVLRSNAQLWLLDEPATTLDSEGIALLQKIMLSHINSGGVIVYTSHQALNFGNEFHQQLHLRQSIAL